VWTRLWKKSRTYHRHNADVREHQTVTFSIQMKIVHGNYWEHCLKYTNWQSGHNFDDENVHEIWYHKDGWIFLQVKYCTSCCCEDECILRGTVLAVIHSLYIIVKIHIHYIKNNGFFEMDTNSWRNLLKKNYMPLMFWELKFVP
jgi:hypothetical protein